MKRFCKLVGQTLACIGLLAFFVGAGFADGVPDERMALYFLLMFGTLGLMIGGMYIYSLGENDD